MENNRRDDNWRVKGDFLKIKGDWVKIQSNGIAENLLIIVLLQFFVNVVTGLVFQRLIDVNAGVVIIFLLVMADCQVVVRFCVWRVFYDCVLVVVYRLFQYSDRVVGVGQVLVQNVIVPVPQTSLEECNALRVPAQWVQCCWFVCVQPQGQVVAFGWRYQFQNVVAQL